MAKGTDVSENLTQKLIDFMLLPDDYELDIFSLGDVNCCWAFRWTESLN